MTDRTDTADLRKELAEYERAASDPREWPHHREHSWKVAVELRAKLAKCQEQNT